MRFTWSAALDEVVAEVLVEPNDVPTELGAGAVPGVVLAHLEVATVVPAVTGLEPELLPGQAMSMWIVSPDRSTSGCWRTGSGSPTARTASITSSSRCD